jgi:gluconokinase
MVLVLMGVTASGKTTIGQRLARRLKWPFYDADGFHPPENIAKMSRGEPLTDADRQPWLQALHEKIAEHVRDGRPAIFACSALKDAYRHTLRGTLPDAEVQFVYLKGDPAVLQSRLDHRKGHFMPRTMLPSQLDALEEPQDALIVNAALTVPTLVRQIIKAFNLTPSATPIEQTNG